MKPAGSSGATRATASDAQEPGTASPVRRPASSLAIMIIAFVCTSTTVDARRAASPSTPLPLEILSDGDAERAGAVGTGCTWLGRPGRKARLSMADDRAAVRRGGVVVALKPASDAKALFLTYDRWVSATMRIVIRNTGKAVKQGYEFTETVAWLDLTEDGRTRSFLGRLNCGS